MEYLSLIGFGFFIWYATGIDDAIIFGGVMSQAKTLRQKWQTTCGLLGAYTLMMVLVTLGGVGLTTLLSVDLFGVPIKQFVLFAAMLFVTKLGWDAWGEANSTDEETDESSDTGAVVSGALALFPKQFVDAFRGFGLNCTDDITVNTTNLLNKSGTEMLWYLLGNAAGVVSMIILVWLAHSSIARFAVMGGWWFHRLRAIGIWFAAFLIYRSGMA